MLRLRSGAGRVASIWIAGIVLIFAASSDAGEGKRGKKKQQQQESGSATPEPSKGLADIPLPVGHEAKGLTLPDMDEEGRLRGKFTAAIAKRTDERHMAFTDLHIATFTEQAQPDLNVATMTSIFDLQTHVLASQTHGTITRSDFQIDGDTMEFNTDAKQGTLHGNVKMVITGKTLATPKKTE